MIPVTPGLPDKSLFPRTQTLDIRTAMAAALVRMLMAQRFPGPGGEGTIQLATGYKEWPSYPDEYVSPSACVLPGEGQMVEARLVPNLLEDTWWPRPGRPGWGLYVLSDYETEFRILVRAASNAERDALTAGIEQLFVQDQDQMLIAPDRGNRYGVLVDMPEYFGAPARFGLKAVGMQDEGESAMREQRETVFTVMAQGKQLRVGLVQPFTVRVTVDPDDPLTTAPTNQLT